MTKPPCATTPLSPSSCSWTSSSASTSSAGSCYVPSCSPKHKKKKSKCKRAQNGAGDAVVVPRSSSSIYRGVTRHKGSGKYEAHLWDRHARSPTKNKKGRQGCVDVPCPIVFSLPIVYLGGFDSEEAAARIYDLAALKYRGSKCVLNFPLESYKQEREKMQRMTREVYLATLRRRSSGFSRGVSEYRGVARHHYNGRWEARIGHASGKKYLYLGTFDTQEEAARAYDLAALEFRGHSAITNFDISSYTDYLQPPVTKAQPQPVLKPKDEAPLPMAHPAPLLQPKPEPEDEPAALPLGPVLRDADDVDHAIAEILPALGMDPAEFEERYPARRARAPGWPSDDLPLPDSVRFEDDIESLFDAPGPAAAATIGSLAPGRWR
ncbi:ethylene-responsive transcription factor WRI1-like [Phragmites australis]|uniref:ethylene-responsive transcription factor WRI1-like n=1 Tax=Phragmites australis TaxID=29695 RepID=UPI002D78BB26|nr:ethylene-responsive transcription factor WRI1-like [Phragmites australis]